MNRWNESPPILKRKFLLTLLAGIGAVIVSLIFFIAAGDRILLMLGGILLVFCVFRSVSIWRLISNDNYETAEGVCTGITSPPFRRYRRIHLLDENGSEFTVLLDRSARLTIGTPYRFYFQKNARPLMGNAYLDASLSTNAFLGYEEIQTADSGSPEQEEK
ncbi:hypothetical protein DS742_17515 [Lacrimispora amygdalina]|uniref:Uncharacterized protein n=1 Tax=Lacrimispora amygdalina TaxID=253257 RepID=A0A3E2N9J1_9FIRM|nr:hypothetical protein [Clostridium indicum]RFZ77652.1 hypothetical protein DS742_17515 [Clostridium indicum]